MMARGPGRIVAHERLTKSHTTGGDDDIVAMVL